VRSRCDGRFAQVGCANVTTEWPGGRLLALPSCGAQTWWLKSDGVDWTEEDRLLLRSAGAGGKQRPRNWGLRVR
jgi:hypothetical protein